ncbi:MAG: TAXI family TRAP transporter solute-binding subunit [Clostridia bacterium]|nr:TAXI family TRAP transporter solute-binding subunit [Clostridia bacterium]
MKKILAAALCATLLLGASSAMAADINFVTAGTSSTFYPISATICQLWNDSIEGMRATATPSGGGIDNLNQAYDGEAQIGIANANLVYQAQEGLASFEGYANENIRIFAGLYLNPNQVVVTKDSGIETLEDLIGKHISVGAAGSTTVDEAAIHLGLMGKTLEDMKTEYMGTSESADAISNKQLDGVWVMAGTPNAAVTQIMTTTDSKILPIPEETVEALKVDCPWYASYVIPAGTYTGQDEDVPTSAVKLTLFITADVDEETVYQMTKTFWENWDMLTETHAALKKADPKEACNDVAGVPIHEGAARYYREIGLME